MNPVNLAFEPVLHFLNTGGEVLWLIFFVAVLLWGMIAERLMFFSITYPQLKAQWQQQWHRRTDKNSRQALAIRELILSEAGIALAKYLTIIKMLIGLCPLLGLLGTVTGMIHVFDVLAVTGTGNARAMASGISHATIPTMAGMVIAIAGLYFNKLLEERVSREQHHLADMLQYH